MWTPLTGQQIMIRGWTNASAFCLLGAEFQNVGSNSLKYGRRSSHEHGVYVSSHGPHLKASFRPLKQTPKLFGHS